MTEAKDNNTETADKVERARQYTGLQHIVKIINLLLSIAIPAWLWYSGVGLALTRWCTGWSANWWVSTSLFFLVIFLGIWLVKLPLTFYIGFVVEHRFGLSRHTFGSWLKKQVKTLLLSLALGTLVLDLLYYCIMTVGDGWWLLFGVLFFALSMLLAELVPIFIIPLFYKMVPLPAGELKERLEQLLAGAGVGHSGLFSIDFSKETSKANAAFTGWGKSRRVVLADTLIGQFTPDEVEAVLAHELGHLHHRHIMKQLLTGFVTSLGEFYVIAVILRGVARLSSPADLAGFPLVWLAFALMGIVITPLQNMFSRYHERQADRYACAKTSGRALAGAFRRLGETNLADPDPPAWIEWYFYSHPALGKRIQSAEKG